MKVRRLVVAAVALTGGLLAVRSFAAPTIPVKPLSAGAPASRYVEEFGRVERGHPEFSQGSRAPNGRAAVELEMELFIPLIHDSCHSVWLSKDPGGRVRILRLMEGDPGSGSSFAFAWSSDSRAVFILGSYSGFNCTLSSRGERLRVIYTLEDGTAWELPALREAQ